MCIIIEVPERGSPDTTVMKSLGCPVMEGKYKRVAMLCAILPIRWQPLGHCTLIDPYILSLHPMKGLEHLRFIDSLPADPRLDGFGSHM